MLLSVSLLLLLLLFAYLMLLSPVIAAAVGNFSSGTKAIVFAIDYFVDITETGAAVQGLTVKLIT